MLFSSTSFLFIFLPIVLILILLSNNRFHNHILLFASIVFYAIGAPEYLPLLFLIVLINYIGAILIGVENRFGKYKKLFLILTLFLDLGILIYYKYFNFIINNINNIFHADIHISNIVLPLGISFYTFQAISYLLDVYKGVSKSEKNLYNLALYICLFPQLVAGPIIKYHDISEQINSREINFENVNLGIKRFIIGLAKKMLIANILGEIADKIFIQPPELLNPFISWLGGIAFTFQIYFDFSGYSDMAIGLGLIFGFKFMENFNYPYISRSITDFWRRWHISLSTFFKEYLYIPLGGNKKGIRRTCLNLFLVFLITGIWHGANWTYIIWGLYNGFFIIIEKLINIKDIELKYKNIFFKTFQHIYLIFVVIIGFVIFRSPDINYAHNYILGLFGKLQTYTSDVIYMPSYYIDTPQIIVFVTAILCSVPIFKEILEVKSKFGKITVNLWLLFIFILSVSALASSSFNPFIYFRF